MSELKEALNRLSSALGDAGIPFVIGGAFALAAHGHPRWTDDLDVMVLSPKLELVHRALAHPEIEFLNEVTFRDTPTGLFIDLLPVEDEAQRAVFEDAERTRVHGSMPVDVLSPEGLAVMLLREATEGDPEKRSLRLRDIELLASDPGLDWDYVKGWAEKMGYEQAYEDLRVRDKPDL